MAFAFAELLALGQAENAACITSVEDWRCVDANPQLRILVAVSPQIAASRAAKDGSILIVPVNIGDRPEYFSPLAAQAAEAQHLVLERPDAESFEKALVGLGEEEAGEYPEDMAFNSRPLMQGEVYSAEPGIYEWGLVGFRHDDTVVLATSRRFSRSLPKILRVRQSLGAFMTTARVRRPFR